MTALTSLDLSPLTRVESVGYSFLFFCCRITTIDLGGLANVMRIGDGFMSEMTALTALDLRPLSRVESVGCRFLAGCAELEISRVVFSESSIWQRIRQLMLRRRR
jgi:ABC-type transporter Mla MlaB component